jgi:hypothetical protein
VPSDGEQLMENIRVVKRWETHPQSRRITQQGNFCEKGIIVDFIENLFNRAGKSSLQRRARGIWFGIWHAAS